MNTGRTKAPLINFIEVNPRETIDKGHLSKKIGMDKLQPFCRDIQEYEIAEFNGGAKFRNSDTIMNNSLFRKWQNSYGKRFG